MKKHMLKYILSVRGVLSDGFANTTSSMRTLFPEVRLDNGLRHARKKLPQKLVAITSPIRTCSNLSTFVALLDYIADLDWNAVRIAGPPC